jgi:hypothetical protein|tara:strand:+ start:3486 stop:4403 length:918 start_codon:yes stop_codon:yes gene_type:complete
MSLTTSASFNPILSEALNKIGENQFVGTQLLPIRLAPTKNGDYPVFDEDQFDLNASQERSSGSAFPRRDFDYSKQSYACKQYALEGVLPDEDASLASDNGISDAAGGIAQKLQRDIMVGHELRVAALMTSAGFNGTPATQTMDTVATAKPIIDIQNAVERLNANGFYDNLSLIMELSLFNEMLNTDDIRGIFNGNGQYTNRQVLRDAFGVQNIIILPTRYNSANKGATASRAKIWEDDEYFVGQIAGGDFSNGGFGRTIAYGADGGAFTAETYRDEPIKSDVLRVFNSVDEVIINTNACEKITGA